MPGSSESPSSRGTLMLLSLRLWLCLAVVKVQVKEVHLMYLSLWLRLCLTVVKVQVQEVHL